MSLAGQPNGRLAFVIRTADRIDYWARRRVLATDLVSSNLWPAQVPPSIENEWCFSQQVIFRW
jgi:hypothetical protein